MSSVAEGCSFESSKAARVMVRSNDVERGLQVCSDRGTRSASETKDD